MAQDYFIAVVGEFIYFLCLVFQIAGDIDVQILIIICHIFFILLEHCVVVGKEEELPSISR